MKKSQEIKLMIINNFITHFFTNEDERGRMEKAATSYVEEDHVDEIMQSDFGSILQALADDAKMALDGTWDKGDVGFEDQVDLISNLDIHPE